MNEIEKAIEIINDVTWQDNGRHYGEIEKTRELATSALEKQISKRVSFQGELFMMGSCPNCDSTVNFPQSHCIWCGQALDWWR